MLHQQREGKKTRTDPILVTKLGHKGQFWSFLTRSSIAQATRDLQIPKTQEIFVQQLTHGGRTLNANIL